MTTSSTRKPVARKSPAERVGEIADAAREVALDRGLSAVTLRAVAARIGIAPALVAHYAPSMDALIASTFAKVVSSELEDVRRVVAAHPRPSSRIAALVDTLLDGTRAAVTLVWVEAWAIGHRNETLATAVGEQMDAWQDVVRALVEDGVAAGEFAVDDPGDVAWQLLGMIDGLNAQSLVRWSAQRSRGPALHRAVEGMLGLDRFSLGAGAP